jgi:hypothetical protein
MNTQKSNVKALFGQSIEKTHKATQKSRSPYKGIGRVANNRTRLAKN